MLQSPKAANYIEGLNGIRALSALLVISTHWPSNFLSLKFGWIGVNIFFVLSGFLITRILLEEKKGRTIRNYLGRFYYKRFLRIFPLYYLFLALLSAVILLLSYNMPSLLKNELWMGGYNAVIKDMPYYLTYTYNLKINFRYLFHLADGSNQFFGHLWSLAVEEQFYLIFPFIVYYASLKNLKRITIAILIICPLIRLWACIYGLNIFEDKYWLGEFIYSNPVCQADALAAGAALVLFDFKIKKTYLFFFVVASVFLCVGLIQLYFLREAGYFLIEGKSLGYNFPGFWLAQPTKYFLINIRTFYLYDLVNLLAVSLILPFILNKPIFSWFFKSDIMEYLGRISYGIYVFHNPLIAFLRLIIEPFGGLKLLADHPILEITIFLTYLGIVIGISHLSYQFFEKKILAFKYHKNLELA
ncbi:acyltransferase family protein [Pedobacter fastidiosus]|uniref:Acyltransferase n=1 Tax=Pedobacter fastidiosus TaxID=2765361 RepID=A0ABR7KVP4_9SPHI|nr:acyltransferase [Pedobacter fastidiosus]MBC6112181.1 acyltransferase [Pedobacter fastidiosus]